MRIDPQGPASRSQSSAPTTQQLLPLPARTHQRLKAAKTRRESQGRLRAALAYLNRSSPPLAAPASSVPKARLSVTGQAQKLAHRASKVAWTSPDVLRHGVDAVGVAFGIAGFAVCFFSPFGYVLGAVGVGLHLANRGPQMLAPLRNHDGSVSCEGTVFSWTLLLAGSSSLVACLLAVGLGASNPAGLPLAIAGHLAIALAFAALVYRNRDAGFLGSLLGAGRDAGAIIWKKRLANPRAAKPAVPQIRAVPEGSALLVA